MSTNNVIIEDDIELHPYEIEELKHALENSEEWTEEVHTDTFDWLPRNFVVYLVQLYTPVADQPTYH